MPARLLSQSPAARHGGLVMTRTEHELMIFDTESNQLHHLNPLATAVWNRLDGTRSLAHIVSQVSADLGSDVSVEAVIEAFRLLSQANLLESPLAESAQPASRRAFLRRSAALGAASIPVVMSVTAPSALAQSSTQCRRSCPSTLNSECSNQIGSCGQCRDFGTPEAANYQCCNPGSGGEYPCNQ